MYALNDSNGKLLWTYHAAGAVKASPTLSGGLLYFGDYSGHVQAISERNGQLLWRSGSGGTLLGSGTFYSTAAVFYGRVFLGNTDGRIYAYDASTGRLDWAVQTGSYVYASPAVTNAPGLGPTIYLGSYNGTFYALNARSGHISWSFNAHGRISGSATIVGKIVYFADLGEHKTYGLGHLHRPAALRKAHRRLRPGDQRRQEHLPDRLHGPVRARPPLAAAGRAGAERPREREARRDRDRAGRRRAHLGEPFRAPADAAVTRRERPVAGVVDPHVDRPRRRWPAARSCRARAT